MATITEALNQIGFQIPPRFNEPLSRYTSIGVGGNAEAMVAVSHLNELRRILKLIQQHQISWCLLGKGTNTLVPDEGFNGIVILLKGDFTDIDVEGNEIQVGAGTLNRRLADEARFQELSGVEFLKSIPGSVGGAIMMNAGAFHEQVADISRWVEYMDLDGDVHQLTGKSLDFRYRHSYFTGKRLIILKAAFSLSKGNREKIAEKEKYMSDYRRSHHPTTEKTWGSVFLNPPGKSAGGLIEACGLKGKRFGGAKISDKHANFIENAGDATFKDLMEAISFVQKKVKKQHGIDLVLEGKILR